MNIRYQTFRAPIMINGPCPICHQSFQDGDLITETPLPVHRACDPVVVLLDAQIARGMASITEQLDREFDA